MTAVNRKKFGFFAIAALAITLAFLATRWFFAAEGLDPAAKKTAKSDSYQTVAEIPQPQKTVDAAVISQLVKGADDGPPIPQEFFDNPPASLAQTPLPARLHITQWGELVVDQRVRRLFEYYLTATGEESLEHIVARIKHALESQLNSAAYAHAQTVLEGYLQYRNNSGAIINAYSAEAEPGGDYMARLRETKQAIRESRSDYLPADVIDSFFTEEDAYDDYMQGKTAILHDAALSEPEKQQELQLLDMNTPEALVSSYKAANQISSMRLKETDLREAGAGDDAINALRERELGSASAQRLARLDDERREWQSRLERYREELRVLESAKEYPAEEKAHLVEELRAQHFGANEVQRVRVLDKIRDTP